MPIVIDLRRQLELHFVKIQSARVSTVHFVLRVGGTLGEFEPLPSRDPEHSGKALAYDIVVPAHPWGRLPVADIRNVLGSHLKPALADFVARLGLTDVEAKPIFAVLG